MKKLKSLSIFFPFWNEEKNVEQVVSKALAVAPNISDEFEILIIDDGSSDKTLEVSQDLAKNNKNIRVISHTPNRGYGAALKEGLTNSKYEYVVFTDGDGQFDFSQVTEFVDRIEDSDLVIGYRVKRNDDNLTRRLLLMNLLRAWDFVLFGFLFKDIDCGFKMFKKEAIEKISPLRSEGAMITTEILAKAKNKKLKITQVPVTHYPRQFGKQTGANLPVVIRAILESLILWYDIHNGRI